MKKKRPKPKNFKPIREGCYIEFKLGETKFQGTVVSHFYTDEGHLFDVRTSEGSLRRFTGARLYNNLTFHIQGKASKKNTKKHDKLVRKRRRKRERQFKKDRRFKNHIKEE